MLNLLRCIVADDEPLAASLLADYVQKTPGLELLFQTTHILKALELVQENKADLVFLDVQMPELNGMQFLKIINGACKIILTTAYSDYAVEGYQYDVVDYLLKPITYDRFCLAIQKAKKSFHPPINEERKSESIFIKTENRIQQIILKDIIYIEALRDYLAFHTANGKILTLDSLRHMEELLPTNKFIRIHKSYIINMDNIGFIEKNRVIIQSVHLPIGDTYREHLLKFIRQ